MKNLIYAVYPQGTGLPKFSLFGLTVLEKSDYSLFAVAKSTVEIGLSLNHRAHSRQCCNSSGFFMRTICAHLCNSLGELYLNYGGLVEGASARRFLVYGKANLDQSTTHKIGLLGGGYKNHHKEAVIMTTTPTQAVTTAMIYTFLIAGGRKKLSNLHRIRTISVIASTEKKARLTLLGLPLVFQSCRPAM